MNENEWNQSHPCQAQAYIEAWEEKQKRGAFQAAELKLIIASTFGKKRGGGDFTLSDFLPDFCKPSKPKLTPEQKEQRLKSALSNMAKK